MQFCKLLFLGPTGSGKSSALEALGADRTALLGAPQELPRTARIDTGLGYHSLSLNERQSLQFYEVPGGADFEGLWHMFVQSLAKQLSAVLVFINNASGQPLQQLNQLLDNHPELFSSLTVQLVVTHVDTSESPILSDYQALLESRSVKARVAFIDGRSAIDLLVVLEQLLADKMAFDGWRTLRWDSRQADNYSRLSQCSLQSADAQLVVAAISELEGVAGAALLDGMGEILSSSLNNTDLTDFIAFVASTTALLNETSSLDTVQRITLRSGREDNLMVLLGGEMALGVSLSNQRSARVVQQRVEQLINWG